MVRRWIVISTEMSHNGRGTESAFEGSDTETGFVMSTWSLRRAGGSQLEVSKRKEVGCMDLHAAQKSLTKTGFQVSGTNSQCPLDIFSCMSQNH